MYRESQESRNGKRDRIAEALLLIAIVAISSVLLLNFSSFRSNGNPPISPPSPPPPATNDTGVLEVSVGLAPSFVTMNLHYYDYYSFTVMPLSSVEYTAVGVGLSLAPLHLNVSQPGAAYTVTAIGLYRVSTQNPYYSLSLYAEVQPHMVTDVQVTLNQTTVPGVFTQVLDLDSSGEVQPWEPMTIHVQGLTGITQGSNVFIVYSNNSATGCTETRTLSFLGCVSTSSSITARVLQADERSNGLWLVVSFPTLVEVQSLKQASVEIITASFTVSTSAT